MHPELEALEFGTALDLIRRGARTRGGREALGSLSPWDGACGLRRLHQMELQALWAASPDRLSVQPMDEALAELLSPGGWLAPEHWRQLREGLKSLAVLLRSVSGLEWPADQPAPEGTHLGVDRLQVTAVLLPDPTPLADKLSRSFDADGNLDPLRVPGLSELHRERQGAYQAIQQKLQKVLRTAPEAFSESSIVERNGRFCLPVRQDRKGLVGGLVLDRSSSGATVFVEPMEAVPLNNDFVEADAAYREAVQAFLRQLLADLRSARADFERWQAFQAQSDQALALLRWASLCDGALPDLGQARLCLLEARHPLLLPKVREALELEPLDHAVVPLNLVLEAEKPGLVISGSNTGGKTVVLKTVGLLWALARSGCAVPSREGSAFPALPSLHADIGDHQTLVGSLSTFSSHVVHLNGILGHASEGGLVLLDELGTGTDPKEGAALGIAVLHALSRRRCWVLCSTHLGDISQWALRHQRFQNASVQFDEERLAPTYRLLVGLPGQSRALAIAARLGLPKPVLEKAESVMGQREQDWRDFLKQLEADRVRLLEEAEDLRRREAAVEKDRAQLSKREEAMRAEQEKFQRDAKDKLARSLDFIEHESKRLVKELKAKEKAAASPQADRVGTEARERIRTMEQVAVAEMGHLLKGPKAPEQKVELKVGGHARHRGLGVEGKVTQIKGGRVVLETHQGRRLECHLAELEPIGAKEAERKEGRVRVKAEAVEVERELNLIGRASDDIDAEVYRFVESGLAAGEKYIRIVHGHGTGKLKQAVREALRGHPGIARVEDASQHQGGAGATLVTLR